MVRVTADLKSGYDSIEAIDGMLASLLPQLNYDEDSRHWISVCVREAAVNANKHGNREDPSKRLTLELYTEGNTLHIYIGDEGTEEFRPEDHFELKKDLLRGDGRGIFFMKQFTDEPPAVEYILKDGSISSTYRPGEIRGKRIRLVKNLPAELFLPDKSDLGQ